MRKILDFLTPFIIIGGMLGLAIYIPYDANKSEKEDYKKHKPYVGQTFVLLNNDTVTVLEWRTGRYYKNRGFILSNGMTVDELVIFSAIKL